MIQLTIYVSERTFQRLRETAAEYEVTESVVAQHAVASAYGQVQRARKPKAEPPQGKRTYRRVTPELLHSMGRLDAHGASISEISTTLNLSRSAIYNHLGNARRQYLDHVLKGTP